MTTQLKLTTAATLAALGSVLPAFAGPAAPVPATPEPSNGDWCTSLKDFGKFYSNKDASFIQEMKIFGRFQAQYAHIDGQGTNGDDFSEGFDTIRRFRLGTKINFFNNFTLLGRASLVSDARHSGGIRDYDFHNWDELKLSYTLKDFAGFEVEASQQLTEQGDGNIFRIDATVGANFDDGRGNVVLSLGYQDRDAVFQGDRSFSEFNIGSFNNRPGGSTTTVPSAFSFACAGLMNCPQDATNFSGNKQVNPASGGLNPSINLFNFNPFNLFQTPFERFNIYAAGNYEISDAVEVYTRGMFSKNNVSTIIAPSGSFGSSQTININKSNK